MRININAGGMFGSGGVAAMQTSLDLLHYSIEDTIEDLHSLNEKIRNVNGGTHHLEGALSSINNRIQAEEAKKENLEATAQRFNTFLDNAVRIDNAVSRTIKQEQKAFYKDFPWLRPQDVSAEPGFWEQLANSWNEFWGDVGDWIGDLVTNVVEWMKEHAVELIVGLVCIVVGAVLTYLTGGAFLAALLAGLKVAAISALVSGTIDGVIALFTGGDFWEAFGDGLASGFMFGGVLSGITQALSSVMRISSQLGAKTFQIGKLRIWSPNSLLNPNSGGTLLKFGKTFRIDVEATQNLLHFHIPKSVYNKLPQIIKNIKWIFEPAKKDVHVRLIPIITPIFTKSND